MSESMEKYVESKCHDVLILKNVYANARDELCYCARQIDRGSDYWISSMVSKAEDLYVAYIKYQELSFTVSQIAHISGCEDIYNRIVKEGDK